MGKITNDIRSFAIDRRPLHVKLDAIPASGLLHEWPIGEGSGSSTGDNIGGNDLSISGATWVSGSNFYDGAALNFDGQDDEATGDGIEELTETGSWTLALSIRVDTLPSNSSKTYFNNGTGSFASAIGIDTRPTNPVILGQTYNGSSFPGTASHDISDVSAGNQITIIYTYDNGAGSTYVDTDSDGGSDGGLSLDEGDQITIGSRAGGVYSDLTVGHVAVWNRILNSTERQQYHDAMPHA